MSEIIQINVLLEINEINDETLNFISNIQDKISNVLREFPNNMIPEGCKLDPDVAIDD